jgi:hypothetical protein
VGLDIKSRSYSLQLGQALPQRAAQPVFVVDWNDPKQREWAENWWQAQQAGHPTVLTWDPANDAVRRAAAQAEVAGNIPNFQARRAAGRLGSLDEYPPNSTLESGSSAWVGHVQRASNNNQGGRIARWAQQEGLLPGEQFEVRIVNRPPNPY